MSDSLLNLFEETTDEDISVEYPLCITCGVEVIGDCNPDRPYCKKCMCTFNNHSNWNLRGQLTSLPAKCYNPRVVRHSRSSSYCDEHLCCFVDRNGMRCSYSSFGDPSLYGHCVDHWKWVTNATSVKKKCHCGRTERCSSVSLIKSANKV
jgi:hypothetical protein